MLAIEIDELVKEYRNGVRALDRLSLKVKEGEIFSLLGPNGAGKSSLISILTTYYKPTSGKVTILGKDLYKDPAWVRTKIACVAQHISIDEHLSLMENMIFQSRMYKVDPQVAKKRIDYLIQKLRPFKLFTVPNIILFWGSKEKIGHCYEYGFLSKNFIFR